MRQPKKLSHSSLQLWDRDREEFYLQHLAENRTNKAPQANYMAIGSAFDAHIKSWLAERVFGKGSADADKVNREKLFESQVEPHNRDWAWPNGEYVLESYIASGAAKELLDLLQRSPVSPQFEFDLNGTVDGIPFNGKPDCKFKLPSMQTVILDWKVKGYCSNSATSPSKGYVLCRDGSGWAKPSRSNGKHHPEADISLINIPGRIEFLEINKVAMDVFSPDYANQISIYGWMAGEKIGDESVICWIDEIVAKPIPDSKPLLRISTFRSHVTAAFQHRLIARAKQAWSQIQSGYIFDHLTREESDQKCKELDGLAASLKVAENDTSYYTELMRGVKPY